MGRKVCPTTTTTMLILLISNQLIWFTYYTTYNYTIYYVHITYMTYSITTLFNWYSWCGLEVVTPVPRRFFDHFDGPAELGCCYFFPRWSIVAFLANQEWVQEICPPPIWFSMSRVSQIFAQRVVQARPKYGYCIFFKEFLLISFSTLVHTVFHVLSSFWFLFCSSVPSTLAAICSVIVQIYLIT